MSEDIVEWLRAQIAAKRARAEAASPGPWHPNAEHDEVLAIDGIVVCEGFALSNNQLRATVDFVVDNDPAAVLAQCEAHTALLDRYDRVREAGSSGLYTEWELAQVALLDELVDLVGLAYQHHPGYQERWRP